MEQEIGWTLSAIFFQSNQINDIGKGITLSELGSNKIDIYF